MRVVGIPLDTEERGSMSDVDHPGPRRVPRPSGLLGMIGLVVLIEIGLSRLEPRLIPLVASDWRETGEAARTESRGVDLLCFGDSQVKMGVVPTVLERELGLTAYNLAVLGGPPPQSYFLLRRAYDSGARPGVIVIDATATMLSGRSYLANVREWAGLLGPIEGHELAKAEFDLGYLGPFLIHRYLPSARIRLDLRQAVLDLLAGREPSPVVPWSTIVRRQSTVNRGSYLVASKADPGGPDPYPAGRVSPTEAAYCYPEDWQPWQSNLHYLDEFVALAESRGARVFFLIPPIHAGVQARREERGLDAAYLAIVEKLRGRHRDMIVVDGRHAGFGHGVFRDPIHLDRDGALALSRCLARAIAANLDAPPRSSRWVVLPPDTGSKTSDDVEDVDQSRLALEATGLTTRR
jgi:hypothetical protein